MYRHTEAGSSVQVEARKADDNLDREAGEFKSPRGSNHVFNDRPSEVDRPGGQPESCTPTS